MPPASRSEQQSIDTACVTHVCWGATENNNDTGRNLIIYLDLSAYVSSEDLVVIQDIVPRWRIPWFSSPI